jgi:hypothetical protein
MSTRRAPNPQEIAKARDILRAEGTTNAHWRKDAPCGKQPYEIDPKDKQGQQRYIARYCGGCAFKTTCLQLALASEHEPAEVYGGLPTLEVKHLWDAVKLLKQGKVPEPAPLPIPPQTTPLVPAQGVLVDAGVGAQ